VANQGENSISVLLGNGDGTFQKQVQYAAGGEPQGTVAGDFNGSGKLGIATTDFYSDGTAVFLGDGDGTFQPYTLFPVANTYLSFTATGDFRGDGKLDLAVTGSSDINGVGNVYILLGNGDGTFQSPVAYPVGNAPYGIVIGDFNNDGRADVAVANLSDNTVSVLLGNGDGTFQPQLVSTVGLGPFLLTAADFNTDGNLDLAVSNTDSGSASVLLGNGDGTFQPHVDYRFGEYPFGVGAADLSGEGAADLAVVNIFSNTVSVLLNLPVISVFPNALNFGKEKVGVQSNPQTITIANPSGTPITISSVTIGGTDATDFAKTSTCPHAPSKLAAGAQCSISVTFKPKATGHQKATLNLKDSVPGSPQSIALAGTGVSEQ
jgi:hypothetical protein